MPSDATIDYGAVLEDLRSKRDQLNVAIAAIEAMLGVSQSQSTARQLSDSPIEPGQFLGLSIADATKKLLQMRRKALRTEIILSALKDGGLAFTSENPVNTVSSVLNRAYSTGGEIVRVERGVWGLAEWYPRLRKKAENGRQNAQPSGHQAGGRTESERTTEEDLEDLIGLPEDSSPDSLTS